MRAMVVPRYGTGPPEPREACRAPENVEWREVPDPQALSGQVLTCPKGR